ncbi:MAG: TIGR03790 family protein [Pedosphaera sp.]|nr:TIGR03790 family protein [Pedosphaera sp.]
MCIVLSWAKVFAGGSGLNIVVIANANSSNSLQLANYFCEKRGVPSQNVLRLTNWTGGAVTWTRAELDNFIRTPLNAMLASRNLSNQIDYVLLSMDIPYRVTNTTTSVNNNFNSTTAALYYGFKNNPSDPMSFCSLAGGSASAYAGSEGIFRATPPISATSNSWLTMMLTASNLAQAKAIVDRGVANDFAFPTQTVSLAESPSDRLRNLRLYLFDDAMVDVRLRGAPAILRTNVDSPNFLGPALGYAGGNQTVNLNATTFAPGAMADNLTSFSGYLLEVSGHTDALDFLIAGATASYGTVIEPCAYYAKFPSPRNYFYQSRGFSIAECYYLSVTNPYQGILVGEPLAAPFALPATGAWTGLPTDAWFSGTTNLSVNFQAPDATRPVQRVDLFVDGVLAQTLTNIAPRQNNVIYVTVNGVPTNYSIPTSATLQLVASNLAVRLNGTSYTNATKVHAAAHGDRVELRSFDLTRAGDDTTLAVSNHIGSATLLTTAAGATRSNFLDHVASGNHHYLITNSQLTLPAGDFLKCVVIKTNGTVVTVTSTNQTPGEKLNNFARLFFAAINTNAQLATADGFSVENIAMNEDEPYWSFIYSFSNDRSGEFDLRARSAGWPESQIQVALTGSPGFTILDAGTNRLDENVADLQPRNHLYVAAGLTNLAFTFALNTTTNVDGYHELTAVAYEGSHVRTQKRVSQSVRIANSPLSATLTCLLCDTNTALEATLQFLVTANTNTISRIELFSTGGSWGVVSNLQSAPFSIAATNLGLGLHPFYAVVMRTDGKQYRTGTKWIRLLGTEAPFLVNIAAGAPTLSWPATAGRRYEILSATNVTNTLTLRDAVTPTNSPGWWSETNTSAAERIYRVRSAP